MILRKPYAFLIKYFRLIHAILTLFSLYIAYKTYHIISFFNSYVLNNYSAKTYVGFTNNYISPFIFISIVLIIIGILGIALLFIYKKKSIKEYVSTIIFYIVLFVLISILKNVLLSIESGTILAAESARAYRDLSLISIFPQAFFIILFLLRSFGLNINKFNFEKDLKEMKATSEDEEEVEFTLKNDGIKLKRSLRRLVREFIYYLKENKFILIIIAGILVCVGVYLIYKGLPEIVDSNYKQGEVFNYNNMSLLVDDSIITSIDYNGNELENNLNYLLVRLNIENNYNDDIDIDYNSFRIEVNKNYLYPILDKGIDYVDYALSKYPKKIKEGKKINVLLLYSIKDDEIKKNYQLKIANGTAYVKNKTVGKFNYVTITPTVISSVSKERTVNLNETVSFQNSNLKNTSLRVDNMVITPKYMYDYEICSSMGCNKYKNFVTVDYAKNDKVLIVLDAEYNLDNDVAFAKYSKDINSFTNSFVKVKYLDENNEEFIVNATGVTPSNLNNKMIIETSNKIENAKSISLIITIRNKEYTIKLR